MRGYNYQSGLGTILVFIGIFCFKALFSKRQSGHGISKPVSVSKRQSNKVYLFLFGLICVLSGILLILNEMKLV